ncbi:MAG: L-rhamnose isomerase [Oscillospiraceae bacterium]|nr:L-rhamnose isomerase [Oscillospiraceae bacterium]
MSYQEAKQKYAALGVDVEAAIERLKTVPVSLHCWQGDDVRGFDTDPSKPLTGGIQTTGSYPGRARTPAELMADLDEVLKLIPGRPKMNLHASYAIFNEETGGWADRDKLEPKHFQLWVDFCRERGLGCDFNPTFFSHPKCDPLTLSSPNEETRRFWIEHGKACIRISAYLAEELGQPCVMNIWTGDGFKDIPADRMGPRMRYLESIDEILSEPYDFDKVKPCIESKVFGIGVEAYTVGSAEFALSYAAMNRDKCIPLMDNGHYHPTEVVSDKIPALLAFFPEIALHVTRPIRWDSDHVVRFDDETREIAKEIVRCGGLEGRVNIALDYFDASINRISAWVTGYRNLQKGLLFALLQPNAELKQLQDRGNFTKLMVLQEELKTLPFGEIWDEYCRRCGKPADGEWFPEVERYEKSVLEARA